MNDFFGKPLFEPTGTDWIDHAFTAAVLDDIEQEERARRSFKFVSLPTDGDIDVGHEIGEVNEAASAPVTYQEAVDFFVNSAVESIKQEYEALGDWWTVYPALIIFYQNTHVWFYQRKMQNIFEFPSEMPFEALCEIRRIIEPWLKTKQDEHTFMFTDPILMNHLASTSLLHYIPGGNNTDTLAELKAMSVSGELPKREYKKYVDIVNGEGK